MSSYRIYFHETLSTSVEVEADNLEDAIDEAYANLPGGICAQCTGWGSAGWSRDDAGEPEVDESMYEVDGEFIEGKTIGQTFDEAVEEFKIAWHRADEQGDEGGRVRAGLRAALPLLRFA